MSGDQQILVHNAVCGRRYSIGSGYLKMMCLNVFDPDGSRLAICSYKNAIEMINGLHIHYMRLNGKKYTDECISKHDFKYMLVLLRAIVNPGSLVDSISFESTMMSTKMVKKVIKVLSGSVKIHMITFDHCLSSTNCLNKISRLLDTNEHLGRLWLTELDNWGRLPRHYEITDRFLEALSRNNALDTLCLLSINPKPDAELKSRLLGICENRKTRDRNSRITFMIGMKDEGSPISLLPWDLLIVKRILSMSRIQPLHILIYYSSCKSFFAGTASFGPHLFLRATTESCRPKWQSPHTDS